MSETAAVSTELVDLLERAAAALAAGDSDAADREMDQAAAVCSALQARGVTIPAAELGAVQAVAERCGMALMRLRNDLNAESLRDDNHRRAVLTYQSGQR
jgi:exosome complex RNA-binding protein Csl4